MWTVQSLELSGEQPPQEGGSDIEGGYGMHLFFTLSFHCFLGNCQFFLQFHSLYLES